MCEIIDNYLEADEHIILKTIMETDTFPWFYNAEKVIGDTTLFHYQFVHIFYANNNENSNFFNQLNPVINKLKPKSLIRIKANLNPVSHELIEYNTHQDQTFECKAAIYYLNDNDGYTMIGKEKVFIAPRPAEVSETLADIEATMTDLGWLPKYKLEDMINDY